MSIQIITDGYVFDFGADAMDAFVFDSDTYNGIRNTMRSVDIIAEFPNEYLFIELKKYDPKKGGIEFRCPLWDEKTISQKCPLSQNTRKRNAASVKRIARDLRQKFCDTFLYRYAQEKIEKSINFICVVEGCDSAITLRLNEIISQSIPKGMPHHTNWKRAIVKNVAVVNVEGWNNAEKLNRFGNVHLLYDT